MNFPGLVLFIGLLVAVELTVFSRASHQKPKNKDDDLNTNNRSQQEGHRRMMKMKPTTTTLPPHIANGDKCIALFSVNGKPPIFPAGNTIAICQNVPQSKVLAEYATLFDTNLGILRYSIYSVDPLKVNAIGSVERKDNWHPTPGITLQGSDEMYYNQPGPLKYQKGHVAPFNILSYSEGSGRASFAYTNAVPQVAADNMGPWKTYEGRIVKYAKEQCAPNGGTLYLITGISEISFSLAGLPPKVQATTQVMSQSFPSHVPSITNKIAIPNSMWTVGCCEDALGKVVLGAFAVFGNNSPKPDILMQTNLGVTKAEQLIKDGANDQSITLFPGNPDCYAPTKQVDLSI